MKKSLLTLATLAVLSIGVAFGQNTKNKVNEVKLEQTTGKFTTEKLTLKPGDYQFEVKNKDVDHPVGFVIAKVNSDGTTGEHIKTSYVANLIETGKTEKSGTVNLEKGEYRFFCPLNPTPEYTIKVE